MPAAVFFNVLDRVDSTNNYAMQQVHAGLATHGMAWFAMEQTAGRGQRGKNWESAPGKNIALSIALLPDELKTFHQFHLSAAIAIVIFDFFSQYAGQKTTIKWPNDLYWCDRKAGGILIETIYLGKEWKWAVAGIGININQDDFAEGLINAVSLKQVTGKNYDVVELARELHKKVMASIDQLKKTGPGNLLSTYNRHLYKRNEKVRLRKGNILFETTVNSVNENGQLITIDTIERAFDFGEVEWMI